MVRNMNKYLFFLILVCSQALASVEVEKRSDTLQNVGISAAISSNTLIVSLKQKDGSTDPGPGSNAGIVGFRSATAANGSFTLGQFTAAKSITLGITDSIGFISGVSRDIYVYLISDTTSEICLSFTLFDDGFLASASALTGGADVTASALWCASVHTNRPIRVIGTVTATWSNPNWGSITKVSLIPFNTGAIISDSHTQRLETAQVTAKCTGTCTYSVTDGITSVTRTGTGSYSVNFRAGSFTAAPSCGISGLNTGTGNGYCGQEGNTDTSRALVGCRNLSGTLQDDSFQIVCVGIRGGT